MITPDTVKSLVQYLSLRKPDETVICPISIIQKVNTRQYNNRFKTTDECSAFFETINNADWIAKESKEFIFENVMFVITALVYYDDTEKMLYDISPYLLDARAAKHFKVPPEIIYNDISEVLKQTHENFLANERLCRKITTACRRVIQECNSETVLIEYEMETKSVIHVSAALSSQQQIWCLLLSYTHNATEIFTFLSKMFLPARKLIYKCRDGQRIPFHIWRMLSYELPDKINGSASTINEFHTVVYSPESRHVLSVYGPVRLHHNVISIKYDTSMLIRQIVCMGLQNWSEIWFKSRWPRHPELIKRLILYRKSTNGRVNQELIQHMFFKTKH
jgi:hypothetical protein